jgi:hypothetical protein
VTNRSNRSISFRLQARNEDTKYSPRTSASSRSASRASASSRPVQPGDVVEVEGLGRLTSHVVAGPAAVPADYGAQPTASEEVISTAFGGDWEFRGIRPPAKNS